MKNLFIHSVKAIFFATTMIIVMISSCKVTKNPNEELVTIDLKKAYDKPARDIMLSELVEDIEYVKLETSPECMISSPFQITTSEHYVLVLDRITKKVLLFTKEGKYLNEIGSIGKGPGEHNWVYPASLIISPDEKHIIFMVYWRRYILGAKDIFNMYNIDGSFIKQFEIRIGYLQGFGYFGPDKFVSYERWSNSSKTRDNKLLIYDKELNLTDSLMFSFRDTTWVMGKGFSASDFSIYKGNIYFQQISNDTIFRIDQTYSITPHLVIDFGGLKIPSFNPNRQYILEYYQPFLFRTINNYDFITLRDNSWRNIWYRFDKYLVYNRISGEAYSLDVHPDPYFDDTQPPKPTFNDMDGMRTLSILWEELQNDKLVDFLNINDAKTKLESGAIDPKKLVTDKYFNELSKLLAESDVEDNPIVRIFHLK